MSVSSVSIALTTHIQLVADTSDTANIISATLNTGIVLVGIINLDAVAGAGLDTQILAAADAEVLATATSGLTTRIILAADIPDTANNIAVGFLTTEILLATSLSADSLAFGLLHSTIKAISTCTSDATGKLTDTFRLETIVSAIVTRTSTDVIIVEVESSPKIAYDGVSNVFIRKK